MKNFKLLLIFLMSTGFMLQGTNENIRNIILQNLDNASVKITHKEPWEYRSPEEQNNRTKCAQSIDTFKKSLIEIYKAQDILSSDADTISKAQNSIRKCHHLGKLFLFQDHCSEYVNEIIDIEKIKKIID